MSYVNSNCFTVLVLDNMNPMHISHRLNRKGFDIVLAFDNVEMYPSSSNPEYNASHASANAIRLIDNLNPDLILLGNNLGSGKDKAALFPKNKKKVTVVLSNEALPKQTANEYRKMGFRRFCIRKNLLEYFPRLIEDILEARKHTSDQTHQCGTPVRIKKQEEMKLSVIE